MSNNRSVSHHDGKNGKKYDILCSTFGSGINEFWSHPAGNIEPECWTKTQDYSRREYSLLELREEAGQSALLDYMARRRQPIRIGWKLRG